MSGRTWANPEKLYYYIQKYLYDGDTAAHTQVKSLASTVDSYKSNAFQVPGYSINNSAFDNPGYIISYMVEKTRPTDPTVVARFTTALKGAADANIAQLNAHAYPVGNSSGGWGHNVQQGIYSCASLLYWRFSKDQTYFDAAASLLNYVLGVNPIGISYVTGLGFHSVLDPHDRQSWYTRSQAKWGIPVPGILVFGPSGGTGNTTFPAIGTLPAERRYADSHNDIQENEFTIFETMTHYGLYAVLANGGKWDSTKDPFASQQVAVGRDFTRPLAIVSAPMISTDGRLLKVSFTLATSQRVRGAVYCMDGKRLMNFDAGAFGPGSHEYSLPLTTGALRAAGRGVLVCKVTSGGAETAKMLCMVK
jgi:hypothetical protein